MASKKIKINIKKVLEENEFEKENLVSNFKDEYDFYCELEKEYEKEVKDLNVEKKDLNKKCSEEKLRINQERKKISTDFSKRKKELDNEFKLNLNNLKKEFNNLMNELNLEKENSNFITKIIWIFTKYPNKKEKEIQTKFDNDKNTLNVENKQKIEGIIKEEENTLNKFKIEEAENLKLIESNEKRIQEIYSKVEEIEKELGKIALKKEFIQCGDKDKYYPIAQEMEDILDLNIYPSIHRINLIKDLVKKFVVKWKNKFLLLEDKKINKMVDNYYNDTLKPNELKPKFMKKELKSVEKLLSNIDGKSLDNQQRTAVITNEDNNLVVAGAGSGKTLTISAKVKYLVDRLHVNPKEILLITFTKKAAEEMQERIAHKLGIEVNVKTFHALGYDLVGFFENEKPEIYDDIDKFINNFITETVSNNQDLMDKIFKYFTTYMNDYIDPEKFDCIGEFYRANKSNSLEAIKFKLEKIKANKEVTEFNAFIDKIKVNIKEINADNSLNGAIIKANTLIDYIEKKKKTLENETEKNILVEIIDELNNFSSDMEKIIYSKEIHEKKLLQKRLNEKVEKLYEEKRTLKWEKVKSVEELIIANYLFACGIKYIYEADYEYNLADKKYRQYKPDFYLPDYNIYIEHFSINELGRCPQYSKPEEIRYLQGIEWKREIHEKYETIMEETYSFEHKQGKLIDKLNSILKKHNIPIRKLSNKEIVDVVQTLNTDNEYKEFYKLLNTFLSLFKSCNFKENDIERFINLAKKNDNQYIQEKHILFLKIFKTYYLEYVKELKKENKIDFNDMINKATDFINEKYVPSEYRYKYIIIDEFQDISVSRYKLINAIKKDTKARVMAVGDDWQSIYRFAGSEISIFTKFAKYFGITETMMIEKTYRNSQELIDIAGKFVMNNPDQIKKNLKSDKKLDKPVILVDYSENVLENCDENQNSLVRRIMYILNSFDKKEKTVLLLGRNNFDITPLTNSEFFRVLNENGQIIIESNLYPHLKIQFMSVHKSKGIEADEVIIINNRNDLTGFPNKMVSDSVLEYVMNEEETFTFAEERRLFYVALTRTKNHCYLMCPDEYSNFIEELKAYKNVKHIICEEKEEKVNCPVCKTGYLVHRKGAKNKSFYSCSNFPQCNFKTSDMNTVKSKVRCPSCGNFMTLKKGPYGEFYGCNSYPNCKTTYSVEEFERLEKNLSNDKK